MSTNDPSAGHAVVVGGSIGGLLAARVLSEAYKSVTVIDRDKFPDEPQHRKGVPQSRHTHGLLAKGLEVFESLLPGLEADLVKCGALFRDLQNDVIWHADGYKYFRAPSSLKVLLTSRTQLEWYVRSRVRSLPQVRIIDRTEAVGLQEVGGRIAGVHIVDQNGAATLPARIVVDATGRGNRGPAWLADLGYAEVEEEIVRANIVYVSREYHRAPSDQDFDGIIHGHYPSNPTGNGTFAIDGNRWLVTMLGMDGNFPSTVPGEFERFAEKLAGPELHDLITTSDPITDPIQFRIGPSVRRRYERSPRLPDGFIAVGDSICCFNPAYGQGMTTAAMEASWLRACLERGSDGLTQRYFQGVKRIIDVPWSITVGNDLRFPGIPGPRPIQLRMLNAYIPLVHRAAASDRVVAETFFRVANFMTPPNRLISPSMLWRVWRARRARADAPDSARGSRSVMRRS
ncbi:NAD(P)/FAD-dependent oxidoreductase [Streptomyces sp. NBC_00233]|uniref:NAD(P)/FAD-dependent oxidoreductase n=1 Tax=Streptomyces sp. NBC_00233 TaxID=2975686 RepID=UPI002251DAEF|nr:FAD-dependent monooxygenase [Streptomyces sp. NBC_00233]MCX5233515.1 FAD-dependent monooxygenase [Streptomyces sp. NBC_00233]